MKAKSQYYPELRDLNVDLSVHSQIGSGYKLADLGSLDEFHDRLAKYDIADLPLNYVLADKAIGYFTDQIISCSFVPFNGAFDRMDKSKSIGFGAKKLGCFSRLDPLMKEYLEDYVYASSQFPHHVIVSASQKDEIRVETKTPRLFTSFPPEHTFLATIVLGDFLRQFINNRFCVNKCISAVGDAAQNGALVYYKEELSRRPFLYCTDTSAQDTSVTTQFLNLVYDKIKLLYTMDTEDENLFEAVRFNSINKLMNVNGQLYLVKRGLGSGDYLTIVINIMWRLYMILENYKYDIDKFFDENTVIICGDDLIMSSNYGDLDLSSKYAKIEWAGKPVTWAEMDFCSMKFLPYIHHDENKVRAVLTLRKKKQHSLSPVFELQRLAGLLRTLTNKKLYNEILDIMIELTKKNDLYLEFDNLYISYDLLFMQYNTYRIFA